MTTPASKSNVPPSWKPQLSEAAQGEASPDQKANAAAANAGIKAPGLAPVPTPASVPPVLIEALDKDTQGMVWSFFSFEELNTFVESFEKAGKPVDPAIWQRMKTMVLGEYPELQQAVKTWDQQSVPLAEQGYRLREIRQSMQQCAFGTGKWLKHFGKVGDVPPLPADIHQILNGPDHLNPASKIKDTHVLVLVPKVVDVTDADGKVKNRVEISLASLGELVKTPKEGPRTQYRYFQAHNKANTLVEESHWVLMKKEILPGSRGKTFAEQQRIVQTHSKTTGIPYEMPHAIDAAACCLLNFVSTNTRLFDVDGPEGNTYTRCQEHVEIEGVEGKWPLIVGGFASGGLDVGDSDYDSHYDGVGAARKF